MNITEILRVPSEYFVTALMPGHQILYACSVGAAVWWRFGGAARRGVARRGVVAGR